MRKMRSCFRSPDVLAVLRPSASSCSSATDFRFSSTISTGDESGRQRAAALGVPSAQVGGGTTRGGRGGGWGEARRLRLARGNAASGHVEDGQAITCPEQGQVEQPTAVTAV